MPHAVSPMATPAGSPPSTSHAATPSTAPSAPQTGKLPILLVGLPATHPSLVGVKPAHIIAAGLASVQTSFDSSPHYALTQHLFGPEESIEPYVEMLKSQQWRGVCIGFGVRGNMAMTVWFEELVRLAQVHAPQARFCFNAGLPDTLASVERNVPLEEAEKEVVEEKEEGREEKREELVAPVVKVDGPVKEQGTAAKLGLGRSASKSEKRKSWDWRRVLR